MKNHTIQKLIYKLVSKLFVFPIYKFVFKGRLIGKDNIPQRDSFIMVSNKFVATKVGFFNSFAFLITKACALGICSI